MKNFPGRAIMAFFLIAAVPVGAHAFMKDGCGSGDCRDCHKLTREEAAAVLGEMVDNVLAVGDSPVGGLWAVDVAKGGQKIPVYLDYSKSYLLSGQVFEFASRRNLTGERFLALNRFDPSSVPVDDAIPVGNAQAPRRVVVFSCIAGENCARQYAEIVKAAAALPDVGFHIKIVASPDPASRETVRAIVCARSVALLEQALLGKPVPPAPAMCAADAVDKIARLAESLQIRSVPAFLMPDGSVRPGFHESEAIRKALETAGGPTGPGKAESR